MTHVILQPAGGRAARQHYADTIEQPVALARLQPFLEPAERERLGQLYGRAPIPVWGVTPGQRQVNVGKWRRIQSGDVTLFARDRQFFASATVTHTTHNRALALNLWPAGENSDTWEYVYFLDQLEGRAIPYSTFAAAAGYKPTFPVQGFSVLDEARSASVLAAFGLDSGFHESPIAEAEYLALAGQPILDPEQPLDREGRVRIRKEQNFLRRYLFGDRPTGTCGICGTVLPKDLLVAAHIKRRSECTAVERCDYRNIVMPMCKLGCDDLFERGYIAVADGHIVAVPKLHVTDGASRLIGRLLGRPCPYFTPSSVQYFQWHHASARLIR